VPWESSRFSAGRMSTNGDIGSEIGDWVDTVLSIKNDYFAKNAADKIQRMKDADVIVVDGIRSVPDVTCIDDVASRFKLIFLHTPFSTRLDRLQDRGRDGEEDVDANYLINRDEQELSWGVNKILSSYNVTKKGYVKDYPVEFFYSDHDSIGEFGAEFSFFISDLMDV